MPLLQSQDMLWEFYRSQWRISIALPHWSLDLLRGYKDSIDRQVAIRRSLLQVD